MKLKSGNNPDWRTLSGAERRAGYLKEKGVEHKVKRRKSGEIKKIREGKKRITHRSQTSKIGKKWVNPMSENKRDEIAGIIDQNQIRPMKASNLKMKLPYSASHPKDKGSGEELTYDTSTADFKKVTKYRRGGKVKKEKNILAHSHGEFWSPWVKTQTKVNKYNKAGIRKNSQKKDGRKGVRISPGSAIANTVTGLASGAVAGLLGYTWHKSKPPWR